jgi:hypothetical protein
MFIRRAAAVVVLLVVASAGAASRAPLTRVGGVLKAIDLQTGTLTVRLDRNEEPRVRTFNLAGKDLPVTNHDGQVFKLADLVPELRVVLVVSQTSEDVLGVVAEGPRENGVVKSIDAAAGTLTLDGKGRGDAAVKVVADARVQVNGKAAALNSVEPGMRVLLTYTFDRKAVVSVIAQKAR